MAKFLLLCLVAVTLIACVMTAPAVEETEAEVDAVEAAEAEEELDAEGDGFQKRFTCDVLSASVKGVKLNHSACAVRCLFKKKKGGYCNKQRKCICRRR